MKLLSQITVLSFSFFLSCAVASKSTDDSIIKGEIIIDLEASYAAEKIENDFQNYELKKDKIISPSLNIVLFKYNSEKIEIQKLIKKVKKHEGVEEAQSNKKTKNRR